MARIVRFPSEAELPEGTVRDFAEVLFELYREAHRPALRDISERIRKNDDLRGTASTETIRRMLRGDSVPANWATVEVVYLALCDLAGRNPNGYLYVKGDRAPIHHHVENTWHKALDNPDELHDDQDNLDQPQPAAVDDPWADEPPF